MGASLPGPTSQFPLVRSARRGDRGAVDALAAEIWPQVRRIALAVTGNPTLADDAAQDAMIRILAALPRFDLTRPLGPWVRTITRNTARNTRNRTDAPQAAPGVPRATSPDHDRRMDLDAAAKSALDAFSDLTPRQRQILELVDHQGLTPSEAAAELDIAPGTVRATLHGARRALRTRLLADRPEILELLRQS